MKISRRELLRLAASLAAFQLASWPVMASSAKPEWRDLCKAWMDLLMPSDEKGPGVNDPLIWENLNKLIHQKPEFESALVTSTLNLADIELPSNKREFESVVKNPKHRLYLKEFLNLLIEQYYSNELGWKDLGIEGPLKPT